MADDKDEEKKNKTTPIQEQQEEEEEGENQKGQNINATSPSTLQNINLSDPLQRANLLTMDKVREVSYEVLSRTRVLFNILASIYGVQNVMYDSLKQSLTVTTIGRKATVELQEDCTTVLVQTRPKDKALEQQLHIFASRALATFLPAI